MRFHDIVRREAGRRAFTPVVPGRPARAGIDPYQKLIVRYEDAIYDLRTQVADVAITETREGGR